MNTHQQLTGPRNSQPHNMARAQVPVNAKMPEVWENRVQAAGERSNMTLVEAAHHFDVGILGYAPLLSGALLTDPVGARVSQHSAVQSIQDVGAKLVQVRSSLLLCPPLPTPLTI